jgi:hypothetical protein
MHQKFEKVFGENKGKTQVRLGGNLHNSIKMTNLQEISTKICYVLKKYYY